MFRVALLLQMASSAPTPAGPNVISGVWLPTPHNGVLPRGDDTQQSDDAAGSVVFTFRHQLKRAKCGRVIEVKWNAHIQRKFVFHVPTDLNVFLYAQAIRPTLKFLPSFGRLNHI